MPPRRVTETENPSSRISSHHYFMSDGLYPWPYPSCSPMPDNRRPVDCTAQWTISCPKTGTTVRIELLDSLRLTTMSSQTDSSTDYSHRSQYEVPLTAAKRKMLLFVVLSLSFKLNCSVIRYLFSSFDVCSWDVARCHPKQFLLGLAALDGLCNLIPLYGTPTWLRFKLTLYF